MFTSLRTSFLKFKRAFWKVRVDQPRDYISTDGQTFRNYVAPFILWLAASVLTGIGIAGSLPCLLAAGPLALGTIYLQRRYWYVSYDASGFFLSCARLHDKFSNAQDEIDNYATSKLLRDLPEVKTILKQSRKAEKDTLKAVRKLARKKNSKLSSSDQTFKDLKAGLDVFHSTSNELESLFKERALVLNLRAGSPLAASALSSIAALEESSKGASEQRKFAEKARLEIESYVKESSKGLERETLKDSSAKLNKVALKNF